METRLNLLCEAGVIDKDICKGMMQVVNVLETECLAQSSHWQAVVQLHQVLLKEFALEVNPCEEGYLLANLYGLWMAANEEV
ncbi:MAG: hypothetical protein E6Z29_11560 [Escherichia coli]|nr:hypothetical protein [Escherichia coli]